MSLESFKLPEFISPAHYLKPSSLTMWLCHGLAISLRLHRDVAASSLIIEASNLFPSPSGPRSNPLWVNRRALRHFTAMQQHHHRMPRHGLSVSWTKSVGTLPSPSVDVVGTSLAAQTHPSRPLTLCPNPHSSITGGVTAPAARLKKRELLLPWQPQQPSPRSRRLLLKLPITSSEQDCQCQPQLLLAPCFLPLGLLIQ